MAGHGRVRQVKKNETVVEVYAESNKFFVVVTGQLNLLKVPQNPVGQNWGRKLAENLPSYAELNPPKQRTDHLSVLLITQRSRVQIPPPQPLTNIDGATVQQLLHFHVSL